MRPRRCQGLCRSELVKIVPPGLEADSRQHLERARPARTERLDDARSSLAKCRRAQQEIVPGQLAMLKALNTSPPTVSLARSLYVNFLLRPKSVSKNGSPNR